MAKDEISLFSLFDFEEINFKWGVNEETSAGDSKGDPHTTAGRACVGLAIGL